MSITNTSLLLETDRLSMREFEETDWSAVHTFASDFEVVQYLESGPNTKSETKDFIRRVMSYRDDQPRCRFELAIIEKCSDCLIGRGCLHVSNLKSKQGWIGYCLHKTFWGYGYATEAALRLLKFGFQELGLRRITATCDTNNSSSVRVLEKLGMRREGHFLQDRWQKGKWRDSFLFALLEAEWMQR